MLTPSWSFFFISGDNLAQLVLFAAFNAAAAGEVWGCRPVESLVVLVLPPRVIVVRFGN